MNAKILSTLYWQKTWEFCKPSVVSPKAEECRWPVCGAGSQVNLLTILTVLSI